jgi:adenylate cyclase
MILDRRYMQKLTALKLSAAMSGLFVLLSIPVLIFILVYNYERNSAAIDATLDNVVTKTKRASIVDVQT